MVVPISQLPVFLSGNQMVTWIMGKKSGYVMVTTIQLMDYKKFGDWMFPLTEGLITQMPTVVTIFIFIIQVIIMIIWWLKYQTYGHLENRAGIWISKKILLRPSQRKWIGRIKNSEFEWYFLGICLGCRFFWIRGSRKCLDGQNFQKLQREENIQTGFWSRGHLRRYVFKLFQVFLKFVCYTVGIWNPT